MRWLQLMAFFIIVVAVDGLCKCLCNCLITGAGNVDVVWSRAEAGGRDPALREV